MVDKEKIKKLIICFLAELLGTAFLVFLGCGSSSDTLFSLHGGLNWGLSVMVVVKIFGCVSGAHVNPAVTIAAAILQVVEIVDAIVYIIAQILGGFVGYGMIYGLLPKIIVQPLFGNKLCVVQPVIPVDMVQALFIELIITLILVLVCCSVWDARNAEKTDTAPIRIGLTVSCLCLAAGGLTGASLNPARALPPAVYHMVFKDHWIYWVAPLVSAIIAPLLYKFVFQESSGSGAAAE